MEHKPSYTDGLYLMHHGIKGQKWGVRRYQNRDGPYTKKGRLHRLIDSKRIQMQLNNLDRKYINDSVRVNDLTKKRKKTVDQLLNKKNRSDWDDIKLKENQRFLKNNNISKKMQDRYNRQRDKLIRDANRSGMDISSKSTKRWVTKRKFDGPLETVVDLTIPVLNISKSAGTKYKVSPKKLKHDGLYLMHHGVKGQKWGVRRYQNPDGSLTDEGRKRIISAHEKRGRAIGRLAGQIGGYFLYDNSDAIASKSKEVAKRAGNSTVASKTKETAKRIGESRPVGKVSEVAKSTGKKVSDKLDNDTTKKIRDKTGNVISSGKESLKRGAVEAKELKKAIDDDPFSHYQMSSLASDIGGAVGERIGAAAGRKIGEASASIQSAYGKHKMNQLMKKNRRIKHVDIYGDYLAHHGILGMHWGVRRFEDKSGHLTPAGKKRYDKYEYDTKPASVGKKKASRSSKGGMTSAQKLALGAGVALTAYGALKIRKGQNTLSGMKDQIASTHASELEGLDPKKKDKILKRVAKEQIYESNRIKQLEKSKDPNASKRIENASRMLTDEHISNRINKLKPKNLRNKPSDQTETQSKTKSNQNGQSSGIFGTRSKAVKKTPGQISSETASVFNANRKASINRTLNNAISVKTDSSDDQKPVATVTRTESKPKKSIFNRKEKKDKPKKKSDPIATAMTAKKVFDTVGAVKNRDYGQAIYNVGTEIVNATDRRIKENRRNKSK